MKIRGIPWFIPCFLGKKRGIPWYFLSGSTQLYTIISTTDHKITDYDHFSYFKSEYISDDIQIMIIINRVMTF
jgi:hypothetical protein